MTMTKEARNTRAVELARAEVQETEAAREHEEAKASYDQARANLDAKAMASAKNILETTRELLDIAHSRVASAHAQIDAARQTQESALIVKRAEATALSLADEVAKVQACRQEMADAIRSFGERIRAAREMRAEYRRQLLELARQYPGDLQQDIETRGKVRLGNTLDTRPGFGWGDQADNLGDLDREIAMSQVVDALADTPQERRARMPRRGVVI